MGKLLHLAYEAGVLAVRFLRRIWTLVKTMFLFGRDIPLLENVSRVYFSYLYLPMLVVTAVFFLNGALHLSYNLLIPLDSITLLLLYLPAYVYACTGLVFLGYKTMTLVADTMSDCYHSKGDHQYYYLKIRLKRAWVRHPVHLAVGLAALPAALCRVVPAGVFGTWTRPASASFSSRASSVLCAELVILTQAVFVTASYWAKRRAAAAAGAARRGTPVAACLGAPATAGCVEDRTFFFTVFWPWVVPKVRDFSLFQLCCAWVVWFVRHDFLIASSRVVEASVYLLAPHVALNGVCALILAVGEVQASVAFLLRNRDKMLEVVLLTCGYVLWGVWSVCVLPSSAVIALAVSSCSALLVRATQVVSGGGAADDAADEAAAAGQAAVGPHGSDGFASSCVGDGRAGRRKRRQRRRTPARTAAASAAAAGEATGAPAEAAAGGTAGTTSSVTVVAPKKKRKRSKQEAATAAAGAAAAVKARREAAAVAAAAAADGGHYTDGDFSSYYYSEELGFGSVGRDEAARRAGEPRYYFGSFTFHQLVTTATSYLERLSLIVFFHSSLVDHAEDTSAAVAAHWGGAAAAAAAAAAGHPASAGLFSGQDVRDWALAGEEAEDGDDEAAAAAAAAAAASAAAVGLRRARSLGTFDELRRRPASPPPPPQALACMADQVKWRVRCRIVIRVLGAAAVLLIVNLTLAAAVQNVLPEGFRGKHSSVLTVYNEGTSAAGGRGPGAGAGEGGRYRRKRFTFTVDGMMQAAECVAKVGYREAVGLYDTTLAMGLAHAEASFLTNTTEEAWARIQAECFEGRAAGGAAACAAVPTAAHGTSPSRLVEEEVEDDASAITLHHLVVGLTLGRAGGGGGGAAAAGGAQAPHRKRRLADGYPTLCRRKWDGVDALAYALFSSMSYLSPRDFRRALRFYNSVLKEQEGRDWVLRYSAESEGINSATFFDVHSASRNLSVIVIRGTSPISPLDYLQNIALYVEVGIYQASTLLLPLFGMLPQSLAVDAIAASSGYEYLFHGLFGTIAKREYLTYYWEHVQRYAERRKAEGVNIVLAGHSMGGAISMIVGSRVGNRGISFHSPGISLSHRKFGIRSVADIHRHTTSIVPENDAITAFDKHGGEVHNTLCAGKRHDACHLMEATVMELWSACPTLRRKLDLDTVSIDFAF